MCRASAQMSRFGDSGHVRRIFSRRESETAHPDASASKAETYRPMVEAKMDRHPPAVARADVDRQNGPSHESCSGQFMISEGKREAGSGSRRVPRKTGFRRSSFNRPN